MAEIKPLRAWRYNESLAENIEVLTSPLFDVVSEKQIKELYKEPYNSIHLSVPAENNSYEDTAKTLNDWKTSGIIVQDEISSIYVYYQYFTLLEKNGVIECRKGFICNVRLYDWDEKVIFRHENTNPDSVNDRIKLLEHTFLNVSPTHGLYSDPDYQLEEMMEQSIKNKIYETTDYQGVRDVLSIISDKDIIKKFMEVIKDKQLIIADGHHRYESSLEYLRRQKKTDNLYSKDKAYNYHLIFLTNSFSKGLKVFPTHRILNNLKNFSAKNFIEKLDDFFYLKQIYNQCDLNSAIEKKKWSFGLILKNNIFVLTLKPELIAEITWELPPEVKNLDLTVMHYFIIEKILGIPREQQRNSEHINYMVDFTKCFTNVMKKESQMAIITKAVTIEEIQKVCFSGFTLPPKSTYFYPKVICGFLFGSILESEF